MRPLRPAIFAVGIFLIWPTGRLSQILIVVALVAVKHRAAKLAARGVHSAPVQAR